MHTHTHTHTRTHTHTHTHTQVLAGTWLSSALVCPEHTMRILELQRGILRKLRRLRRPAARNRASPTDASMTDLTYGVDGRRAGPVLPRSESTETAEDVDSSDESDGSENGELGDIGRAGEGGCDLRVGDTLAFRRLTGGDRRKTSASSDSSGSLSQAQEFSIVVGPSGWLVADATDASVSAHVCLSQHQAQTHVSLCSQHRIRQQARRRPRQQSRESLACHTTRAIARSPTLALLALAPRATRWCRWSPRLRRPPWTAAWATTTCVRMSHTTLRARRCTR